MKQPPSQVVNVDEVEEVDCTAGECWGGFDKPLTPSMRPRGGRLGVNLSRLPQGRTMCPFHFHEREDEAFFVISGCGVLRYGEEVRDLRPGDCVSCPAGRQIAHQLANPYEEDLVYLAIGVHDAHEVCAYPDSGKVLVRSLGQVGFLSKAPYLEAEPAPPRIFGLKIGLKKG